MKVVGKDGAIVGTVDRVEEHRIKLAKGDGFHHHYVDKELVGSVDGNIVELSLNANVVPLEKS